MKRSEKKKKQSSEFAQKINREAIQRPHEIDMQEKRMVLVSFFVSIVLSFFFLFFMSGLAVVFGYYNQLIAILIFAFSFGLAISMHLVVKKRILDRGNKKETIE